MSPGSHPRPRRLPATRRRRLALELLERRELLDGDPVNAPLSAAQRQALISGLNGVATWTGAMASEQQLSLPLAIVGQSISQIAAPQQMLANGIVSRLSTGSATATNTNQFVDAIKNLAGSVGQLTVGVDVPNVKGGLLTSATQNELQFTASFNVTRQSLLNVDADLGPSVSALGLSLDSALPLPLTSSLQFSLTFGFGPDARPDQRSSVLHSTLDFKLGQFC